jgi:hypothetical protein
MSDLVAADELVIQSSGSVAVEFPIEPMRPEQTSFLKEKAHHVTSSTRPQDTRERGVRVLSSWRGNCCIICRKTHAMSNCLFAPWGFIPGCTFCNTRNHTVDTCDQFAKMSMKEKAELLVYGRANRPMLETGADGPEWDWYLREYLKEAGNDAIPEMIPWTSQHAKSVSHRPDFKEVQAHFDERGDANALPKDPAHVSFDAVRQLYWSDRI